MKRDATQLSSELEDRLCDILVEEDELVAKWYAVAEVIGSDGRRWLRTFCPENSVPWDNLGLLAAASQQVEAQWGGGDHDNG